MRYFTDGVGFGRDGHESVGSDLYAHNATRLLLGGTERTPISSARALGMSAEGLAEPQPQRRRTVVIPSIVDGRRSYTCRYIKYRVHMHPSWTVCVGQPSDGHLKYGSEVRNIYYLRPVEN